MSLKNETALLSSPVAATVSSPTMDLQSARGYALQINVATPPAAKTFKSNVTAAVVIQDLTFTSVASGTAGNALSISFVVGGTTGAETVSIAGNVLTVHIHTAVSTATQVKAAWDANASAVALATCAITGTGATAQIAASAAALTGGVDTSLDLVADTMAIASHGFYQGLKVQATTTGTLPTGLATTTDYWVIRVSASSIKLASSLANATAGTAINLTAEGSGTHTLTSVTGTISHSLQLEKSCDGSNWKAEGSATVISAAGSTIIENDAKAYQFIRVTNTVTTGQAIYTLVLNAK